MGIFKNIEGIVPKRVLIIRFSSIGDIVLTSPVIRSLKKTHPNCEIHYVTKEGYKDLVAYNPNVSQVHVLGENFGDLVAELKEYQFDLVIDLHRNLRTLRLKWALKAPSVSFYKANWPKYKMVRFKRKDVKISHVVERYLDCLRKIGIQSDKGGLELYLSPDSNLKAKEIIAEAEFEDYDDILAVSLGAQHFTKRWPVENFIELLNRLKKPTILLGGKDTLAEAEKIRASAEYPVLDLVGKTDVLTAAAVMQKADALLTHDSGFMHIGAAFNMKIISLWGNTVPAIGFAPYKTENRVMEVEGLGCRPCSKIGHNACPKGHFDCMKKLTVNQVLWDGFGGMYE